LKILTLDIETAPNQVYTWGLWKQNIAVNQIVKSGHILSWSAKWTDKKDTINRNLFEDGKTSMLRGIHTCLDEADTVVHYNGIKFDIPWINGEMAKERLAPPSPFRQVDLLRVVRNQFNFPSNKLEYVAKALGVGKKTDIMTFEDWVGCMNDDPASWKKMIHYNNKDVELTEELYFRLLPWIKQHPNHGLYLVEKKVCPNCGGSHYQQRGTARTAVGIYKRYQCQDCGKWFRGNVNEHKPAKKFIGLNY
jgi:DNA polymerase elongation subunit (family B)